MNALLIDSADHLTQSHFDVLAQAVQVAQTGKADDWQDDQPFDGMGEAYGAAKNVTATREPISAFDGSAWREANGRSSFMVDGFQCLHWKQAQVAKGDQRCELTVVDFGGIRLCYKV